MIRILTRLMPLSALLTGCAVFSPAFRSAAAPPAGPLRIHPANPRYFTDGVTLPDGSLGAVYLTGAHTWNNLVDIGRSDPPEQFEWEAYLNFLQNHHHNFIRLWVWDSTTWTMCFTKSSTRAAKRSGTGG